MFPCCSAKTKKHQPFELSYTAEEKPHLKLLLIGKTGSGKTTCLNMMINLASKSTYEDKRMITITQRFYVPELQSYQTLKCNIPTFQNRQPNKQGSSSMSQTQCCSIYSLERSDLKLTLVDTPGLGDTRGVEQDKENIKSIILGIQTLTQINAICYVHKATDIRKDIHLRYYIQELTGMLTKEYQKNFVVLFTNVVNFMKIDAIPCLNELEIPIDNYFCFENDCLKPFDFYKFKDEEQKERFLRNQKHFWQENQLQFDSLMNHCLKLIPQLAEGLKNLFVKKETMIKIVCEKQIQIKQNESYKVELQQTKKSLEIAQQKLSLIKDSDINQEVVTMKMVQVTKIRKAFRKKSIKPGKATQCHNCLNICHKDCNLAEIYQRGHRNLVTCAAFFNQEQCRKCNHSVDYHGHTDEIDEEYDLEYQEEVPRNVKKLVTDQNLLQMRQEQQQAVQQLEQEIIKKNQMILSLSQTMEKDLKKIIHLYCKIDEISMRKPTNEALVDYLQQCIKTTKEDPNITLEARESLIKGFERIIASNNQIQMTINEATNGNQQCQMDPDDIKDLDNLMQQVESDLLKQVEEDDKIRQTIINKNNGQHQQKQLDPQRKNMKQIQFS